MLEPPADLPDSTLVDCLRTDYGLPIAALTFLPLGHDAHAWVYRASTADGVAYFVKVRTAIANEAGLIVPHHLVEVGVVGVVAPLATSDGRLWTDAAKYAVIVYPFVSGGTGMDLSMNDAQWTRYGELVRAVHDAPVTTGLEGLLRSETFEPDGSAAVELVDAFVTERHFDDPRRLSAASFWRDSWPVIGDVLEQSRELGRQLAQSQPSFVLCHADIHTNNVLVDDLGELWFVDWDEAMLAPRERDLMFAIGGIHMRFVDAHQERLFRDGYGAVEPNPVALAYYRYAWAVGDIGAYGEQVFLRSDLGSASVADAYARLRSLFDPGSIVEIALTSQVRD